MSTKICILCVPQREKKGLQRLKNHAAVSFLLLTSVLNSNRWWRLHTVRSSCTNKSSLPSIRGLPRGAGVSELLKPIFSLIDFLSFYSYFWRVLRTVLSFRLANLFFKFPQSIGCSIFHSTFSNVVSFSRRKRLITAFRFLNSSMYNCFIIKHTKTSFRMTRYFQKQSFAVVLQNTFSKTFCKFHRKIPVLGPLPKKVAGLLKKDSNTGVFLWKLRNF